MTAIQRYCPHCGQANGATAQFCGQCGQPLPDHTVPAAPVRRWGWLIGGVILLAVIGAVVMIGRGLSERSKAELAAVSPAAVSPTAILTIPPSPAPATETLTPSKTPTVTPTTAPSPTSIPTATPTETATATAVPTPEIFTTQVAGEGSAELPPIPLARSDVTAVQVTSPPIIDGSLTEWLVTTTYLSAQRVYNADGWDGSEDLTAVWQLSWDNNNLYIGATVSDDIHVQTQTGLDIYRGDSLEMQIDTDRAGDLQATKLSPDDFQLAFSPGDFNDLLPSAVRVRGSTSGQIQDAPGHAIVVAARRTTAGYTLEAAVPWSDLFVTPRQGLVLGLALNANDNDTLGTAVQEVMMSNAPARRLVDPTTWGTLALMPAPAADAPIFQRSLFNTEPQMTGEDVHMVQQRLFDLGYTQVGEIDGIFGPFTEGAVKAFQTDRKLLVDGIVGPVTWSNLFETVPLGGAAATSINVSVAATQPRNETGLNISQGQIVIIEFSGGSWRAGPYSAWSLVGPNGDPQVLSKATFPIPDAPVMSLIGGVGQERPFLVGERIEFVSEASGQLWLGANDDGFADNDGTITVRITSEN